MHLIIAANPNRSDTMDLGNRLKALAQERGFSVSLHHDGEIVPQADAIAVVGGDGSLIRMARVAVEHHIPIFGVHAGRVGFLTEVSRDSFAEALARLERGAYQVEQTAMLSCRVNGGDEHLCLNDVLIYKHSFSGVAQMTFFIDQDEVGTLFGDGIVISTPTGATGYSLSAGGPIVASGMDAMLITPICPHTLHIRPIVAAMDSVVRLTVADNGFVAADGERIMTVNKGDEVTVTRAKQTVPLLTFEKRNRFRLISQKLT